MPDSMDQMIARMIDFYNKFINFAKKLGEKDTEVIAGDSHGHAGSNTEYH